MEPIARAHVRRKPTTVLDANKRNAAHMRPSRPKPYSCRPRMVRRMSRTHVRYHQACVQHPGRMWAARPLCFFVVRGNLGLQMGVYKSWYVLARVRQRKFIPRTTRLAISSPSSSCSPPLLPPSSLPRVSSPSPHAPLSYNGYTKGFSQRAIQKNISSY